MRVRHALHGSFILVGATLFTTNTMAATTSISTATSAQQAITTGDSLEVTSSGSIIGTSDPLVHVTGAATAINNAGTIENTTTNAAITINAQSGGLSGALSNSGTIKSTGDYAIEILDGNIAGGILNNTNGNIITTTSKSGLYLDARNGTIQIDTGIVNRGTIGTISTAGSDGAIYLRSDVVVNGGITNSGTLNSSDEGINIYQRVIVNGGITNSGTINVGSGGEGISITQDSKIVGDIWNTSTGVIDADANGKGIYLNSNSAGNAITGNIKNDGTITSGSDAIYLNHSSSTIAGSILNTGRIESEIYGSGIDINGLTLTGSINNSGQVISHGFGQDAIYVSGSGTISGDIINSGSILAKERASDGNGGSGIEISNGTLTGTIINSGTIASYDDGDAAIYVNSSATIGGISNTGTIAGELGVIDTTEGGSGIHIEDAIVTGSIINHAGATIKSSGAAGDGIVVNTGASVAGSITNAGTIHVTTSNTSNLSGIEIDDAVVTGAIVNSGTITSDADNGITVWGNNTAGVTGKVLGGIINSGTITAYQEGMDIDDGATINNGITNSGTITALNAEAIEIDEDTVVTGGILNTGTMKAGLYTAYDAGADGVAIIQGSSLTGGFVNRGTIIASDDALDVDSSTGSISGGVHNYGTMVAMDKVIDTHTSTTFTGGITNYQGALMAGEVQAIATAGIDFTNSGTLSLKEGVAVDKPFSSGTIVAGNQISGNYTQTTSGILVLGVDDTTTYSNLAVTGNVNLPADANFQIDLKNSGNNINDADVLQNVIASSGTLTSSSFKVGDNSLKWKFTAINDGSGGIDLTATDTGMTTIKAAVTQGGGSGGGAAFVLDSVSSSATGDMAKVIDALGSANDANDVSAYVAQTLPTLTGDTSAATIAGIHAIGKIIQARADINSGLSAGNDFIANGNAWVKPYHASAEQDTVADVFGYDAKTSGLVLGIDNANKANTSIGLAFSYGRSDVDSKNTAAPQTSRVNHYQLINYGTQVLDPTTEANYQIGIGYNQNQSSRSINFGTLNRTAAANYSSTLIFASAGVGRTFVQNTKTKFNIAVRGDLIWSKDQAYTETGADALNLTVKAKENTQMLITTDTRYVKVLEDDASLQINTGLGYDFSAGADDVTASYAGSSNHAFVTKGIKTEPWIAKLGIGYTKRQANGVEIITQLDLEKRKNYTSKSIYLKIRGPVSNL